MRRLLSSLGAVACTAVATAAAAAPIVPVAYDMPNGQGQASGGSFNYWDRSYSGSGSTTTDGAPLTGGRGDLTDGVTTNQNWFSIENPAGSGPYVGWRAQFTLNPTVLFRFGSTVTLDGVTVHMDDSDGAGAVDPPSRIGISTDNVTYTETAVTDPAGSEPFSLTLALGGLSTDRLYVRFFHQNQWVFIDEVSFDGSRSGVPVPGSLALLGIGFAVLGAVRRRR